MPGRSAGYPRIACTVEDVDGRDKPGHDEDFSDFENALPLNRVADQPNGQRDHRDIEEKRNDAV
jgi:hypothetical protein